MLVIDRTVINNGIVRLGIKNKNIHKTIIKKKKNTADN